MKNPALVKNEIYHIYNRGVEKRNIFMNNRDYFRFIHNLFEFNDSNPALNLGYRFENKKEERSQKPRNLLVEIMAFCAMPNHFHLLLRQATDSGITDFMRKLGTGYTNYFNKKYERVGSLFQGPFKAVLIEKESQLLYIPHYIHLNPLDLVMPSWREKIITDSSKALTFLESYRWSSYLDYINKKNFPSITQIDFYRSLTSIDYKREITEWLKNLEFDPIQNVLMD